MMLEKLGSTLVPVALVSVGTQLRFQVEHIRKRALLLTLGLLAKLVFMPALMMLLYLKIFPYEKNRFGNHHPRIGDGAHDYGGDSGFGIGLLIPSYRV